MDKTKSSKGNKVMKHEKPVLHYPPCLSTNKDKNFFKVEENDFPSLSEVREKRRNASEKETSTNCEVSSLTYSSKLKTFHVDCSSQNVKLENVQHCEGITKNESSLNKTSSSRHLVKPLQATQSNCRSFTKHSPTAASNVVPSSTKKSTGCNFNSSFSEVKNKKSENVNVKTPYGQKSINDNRSLRTAHGESSTYRKEGYSPKKYQNPNNSISANVQKPSVNKSLSTPRKVEYSSAIRSEKSYNKESDRHDASAQHKTYNEANRFVNSRAINSHGARMPLVNAVHGYANGNVANKTRMVSGLSNQMAYNSVKPENNVKIQTSNPQSSSAGAGETKKKKKRKSKLKRQAALQTGKILFLTPEVHSKIVNQSNNASVQKHQKVLTNINDNEEYPELGAADLKSVKESHVTSVHTKEENPANLLVFGSETDRKENLPVSMDSSSNDKLEAAAKSDEKNNVAVEKSEGEKSTIHSNNPITLSLFDILVTAKPRKKEPEKKEESTEETNMSAKVFKKEMIKKNVPQAVNSLASSKLTIKRGKEREKPKVKKPSRMRKLILMERQLRRENMEMKKHEMEDANQEKSEEVLSGINMSDVNEFLSPDNQETCDEILQNYFTDLDNDSETFELYDDLSNKSSVQFVIDSEDANPKNCDNISEQISDKLNNLSCSIKNQIANIDDLKFDLNSASSLTVDIQNDFVANPASTLKDKENNFGEDLVDVNTVENTNEICCSTLSNLCEYIKDNKFDSYSKDENVKEKIENDCQTYNFSNRMQDLENKATDKVENVIFDIVNSDIDRNVELNSEKISDSHTTKAKQSSGNLDSSENIVTDISEISFSYEEKLKATKFMLHSRKFRQYCNHFISKEIDQAVFSLIDDLARFQDRMYQKDPVKAKIRRRLVYGLKEIKKHMKLKKVKCIIIATDIEDVKIEGGLNDSLGELISLAEAYHVPCVFSHRRFNLGKVCRKSVPVSCVGIFNYEGSEKNFKKMIELHDDSKHDYLEVIKKLSSELTDDKVKELFEAEKESILSLREVSQRILRGKVYFTPEGYRNNGTSDSLEKSPTIISEDSVLEDLQQSENSNLFTSDEKSLSFIKDCSEELKKLDKNLFQCNDTDINSILVKYKVMKQ